METTIGDSEVENSIQCSICHFSFSNNNIPNLSKEYNLANVQNVCSVYLSPTLLCPDNFLNNGFPKLFPSFFCRDCVKAIEELIEIHENLVRIQQRIKEFVDEFAKNALNCRHKVKSKRKRKTFHDRNKPKKIVALGESPDHWRHPGQSTQQSPFSIGNFQLKDFSICLERIDGVKQNLNSCTNMTNKTPRKLIKLAVLDDYVREDNLRYCPSLKNGCIDNPVVENQGKNISESVSCSKRWPSNEEMSIDLEDGVFCGSSEVNIITNNKKEDDTPKLDVNVVRLNSSSQSANSHMKGIQLKEFSICLERTDTTKAFNGSKSSSTIQSTRADSDNDTNPYTEGTDSNNTSRGFKDGIRETVNNENTFSLLLINNCETELTEQLEEETKEMCITLEKGYQNEVTKDSQDLQFEDDNISDRMSKHGKSKHPNMENFVVEEKIEIEEFIDYEYEDSSFLAHETSDSETNLETLECGVSPLAPMVEGFSNQPEDSPAEKNLVENHIVAVSADDSMDCAEVTTFSGRIKRKAAIKANSKILRVTKEVIHSESRKNIISSPEDSSYEDSTDDSSECDEELCIEKDDKRPTGRKRGRKFNSQEWTTSREKKSDIKERNLQKLTKTNKKEIPYECQVCHEKFSYMDYINHSRFSECPIICKEGESSKTFDCGDCGKEFKAQYLMLHHSAKQHNDFKCNLCNYTGHKFDHFLKHTNETACICDICGMPFLRFKYFKEHRMTHIGNGQDYLTVTESQTIKEIPYECKTCQEKFDVFNEFSAHIRSSQCPVNPREGKETSKLFQCEKCKETFKAEYLLLHHRANEHNSGKCGVCNKKTMLSDYDHFGVHTGEVPCYCDICDKPIKQFSSFKSHRKSHLGKERLHLCDRQDCSREFKTIYALRKHLEWHYNSEKGRKFSCKICQKEYTRKDAFDIHVKSHSRNYVCNDCGKTFTTNSGLNVHSQLHTGYLFPCTVCDKKFSTKILLNQHYRVKHLKSEKRYPCSFCDKRFGDKKTRDNHVRVVHTREKPFECKTCGKNFHTKRYLKIHEEQLHSTKTLECPIEGAEHFTKKEIPYECQICHVKFSYMEYTNHSRFSECPIICGEGESVNNFSCGDCGKKFKAKYLMLHHSAKQHNDCKCNLCNYRGEHYDHFLKHTNETACICDICGKPLLQFKFLKGHRLTHIGEGQDHLAVTEFQTIDEIPYECKFCLKKFSIFNEFSAHIRNSPCPVNPTEGKETSKLLQCEKCKETFKAEYLLLHHRANEHDSRKCGVCNKKTKLSDYNHFVLHTGEIPCYCDICNKPMKQFRSLKLHRLTHIGQERIHLCDRQDCSREFKTISALRKHLEWHRNLENGKTFSCKICQKKYTRKDAFDMHVISHSRKYLCNHCGKTFTTSLALNTHSQRHSGNLFPCNVCDKTFSMKIFLNQHYKVEHLKNEKKYPCSFCDQGFDLHSARSDHVKVAHAGEKPFECKTCGESFPTRYFLVTHKDRRHSNKTFECHICKKILLDKHSLNMHNRCVHSKKKFKCDVCDRSFSVLFNLTTHKRSHSGVKPYQCDECGKTFTRSDNLNTHVKMHAKDKQGSLKCKICGDSFANKKNMSEHMKIIHNVKPRSRPNKKTIESESESSSDQESADEGY